MTKKLINIAHTVKFKLLLGLFSSVLAMEMDKEKSESSSPIISQESSSPFPNWEQRPADLVNFIDESFYKVLQRSRKWGLYPGSEENGSDYCLMGMPDPLLIESLIYHRSQQKTWIFMDLGAGNGAWGRTLASYLTRTFEKELASGTKAFHIISLSGDMGCLQAGPLREQPSLYNVKLVDEEAKINFSANGCQVYEWSFFKIENLMQRVPSLKSKVDAIFSFATFRHLADPLGTYAQAYMLLKPQGLLITDQHVVAQVNDKYMEIDQILNHLGLPYVTFASPLKGITTWKEDTKTDLISWQYNKIMETPGRCDTYSTITSPCHVHFSAKLNDFISEDTTTLIGCNFPGMVQRRQPLTNATFSYNASGYHLFETLLQPAAAKVSSYLSDESNTTYEYFMCGIEVFVKSYKYLVPYKYKVEC
ncbi:methyltransferase domain-containing protein [Candidatus Odyssella thessalonicensis]|uniref:methyltransferase domain-containing protein n=1 Tax=Candidatus Odyssella thessalonicensis TaxID=84647 RepID=UPI000225ACB4|nr:class I SAM-dependent methyltransferase [Candidatus Odyssella thessalonicensis]